MKTKELEKYPLQILMMTLTSFLTLLIPKLLSYLIDDILYMQMRTKDIIIMCVQTVVLLMEIYMKKYI